MVFLHYRLFPNLNNKMMVDFYSYKEAKFYQLSRSEFQKTLIGIFPPFPEPRMKKTLTTCQCGREKNFVALKVKMKFQNNSKWKENRLKIKRGCSKPKIWRKFLPP